MIENADMFLDPIYKKEELSQKSEHITEIRDFTSDHIETVWSDIPIFYDILDSSLFNAQKCWNTCLIESSALEKKLDRVEDLLEKLVCAVDSMHEHKIHKSLINDVEKAYLNYLQDENDASLNNFSICSIESLKQFSRYLPSFHNLHHNVYVDKNTGFFGILLKNSRKSKPLLNLLLQENGEVIFSFIDRKKGMIKITGRAHFNENLEDSSQVKHLLRMIKF